MSFPYFLFAHEATARVRKTQQLKLKNLEEAQMATLIKLREVNEKTRPDEIVNALSAAVVRAQLQLHHTRSYAPSLLQQLPAHQVQHHIDEAIAQLTSACERRDNALYANAAYPYLHKILIKQDADIDECKFKLAQAFDAFFKNVSGFIENMQAH